MHVSGAVFISTYWSSSVMLFSLGTKFILIEYAFRLYFMWELGSEVSMWSENFKLPLKNVLGLFTWSGGTEPTEGIADLFLHFTLGHILSVEGQ